MARHLSRADEVRAFLIHMHANLDVTGFGPREIVGDDERAAMFGWFGLRPRPERREIRSAFSVLLEQRDRKIGRYQFLESTFDVALAFRSRGSWAIQTDGTTKSVPAEREASMATSTEATPAVAIQRCGASESWAC